MSSHTQFHWGDYVLFSVSLAVGLVIGVISWCTGGRQKTSTEYLLGGRKLNVFAVGTSIMVSGLNAVFLLGGTAEVYYRGAIYGLMFVSFIPILLFDVFIVAPLWRQVEVTSAYEYLQKRYDSLFLRLWGAALFSLKTILFLSVVLYAPAMALSQVTDISIHISIILCGAVCALYTVLGGLKAVVWTDCIQLLIMLVGLLVICIMGTVQVGGPNKVFQTAKEIGRLNLNNFDPNPQVRHTVWTVVFGYAVTWGTGHLYSQTFVQRLLSVKDLRSAQWSVVIFVVCFWMCLVLVVSVGILAAVYYKDCDPLVAGHITAGDQILPYFFMDILGPYHGLPGLFISAIFAAALSTVSSLVNSLAAIFLEDFLKPFMESRKKPIPSEKEHIYAKVLSAVFGVLSILLAYLAPLLGKAIIQIPPTVFGAIGGPLFSIFFLGFFVKWSHKWGAFGGSVIGLALNLWIGFGSIVYGKVTQNLHVGQCVNNETITLTTPGMGVTTAIYDEKKDSVLWLYNLSYVWLGTIGAIFSIIAGLIISAAANLCGYQQDITKVDPSLLFDSRKIFYYCYPTRKDDNPSADDVKYELKVSKVVEHNGQHNVGFMMENNTPL